MGTLRKKSVTKPLPPNAELFFKNGQQLARWIERTRKLVALPKKATITVVDGESVATWIDRLGQERSARVIAARDGTRKYRPDRIRTAPVVTGKDGQQRISVECGRWFARFRDSTGYVVERSTGCTDRGAAETLLKKWERQTELVNAEVLTASEVAISDHARTALSASLDGYIRSLKAAGRSDRHVTDTNRLARQISSDCGFRVLRDIDAERVEIWLVQKIELGMAARTRNSYTQALKGFCSWCVKNRRLTSNPLQDIGKADEESDRRLVRRALTEAELLRLLYVTRWRPLAELGRETIRKPASKVTGKRDTWNPAPLTFETIDAAVELARTRLADKPERIAELEEQGRERALIVKTLVLTGLRSGELRSITVGQVCVDAAMPCIELAAKDEKNRDGSDVPLRDDLAEDIRQWLRTRQATSGTLRFDGGPALQPSEKLFYVPSGLLRILDRDLLAAGIPKKDDRGRSIDVHAMRGTFCTLLSQNGVAPRTAQKAMRHSKIDLTMTVYTDPRLLDVAGALDQLPPLSLDASPKPESETAVATGTDDRKSASQLALQLARNSFPVCISGSISVTLGKIDETTTGNAEQPQTCENSTKKGSFSRFENEPLKRPRRDLNPQPPDRQSGDTGFQAVVLPEVTATCTPVGPQVGQKSRRGDSTGDDFSAAVLAIMALPLSDDERADAVRRLLERDDS